MRRVSRRWWISACLALTTQWAIMRWYPGGWALKKAQAGWLASSCFS